MEEDEVDSFQLQPTGWIELEEFEPELNVHKTKTPKRKSNYIPSCMHACIYDPE